MRRVAVGTSSFASADEEPLRMLRAAGVEVVLNTKKRALTEDEALAHVEGAEGWIAGGEPVSRRILTACPLLRAVARVGVGLDSVDLIAAEELGVAVSRTLDAPTDAVAEMTLAALLALTRRLVPMGRDLAAGRWTRHMGAGLRGTTVLVVGYGRIGRRTAELLRAFGAVILVCDPEVDAGRLHGDEALVSLDDGLSRAEVVTLHATAGRTILDRDAFARLRPGALLLNSARGQLVDEVALAEALTSGRVAGCWLDVFGEEPYRGPLLGFDQVLATPHAATFTRQCRRQMEVEAVENLLRDLASSSRRTSSDRP